ncbi:MAG: hypothetical protein ACREK9_15330 [Candidatus Rokuibacteriota bacterium]
MRTGSEYREALHDNRYNELANGVLRAVSLDMPAIDLDSLRAAPLPVCRQVAPIPGPAADPNPRSRS